MSIFTGFAKEKFHSVKILRITKQERIKYDLLSSTEKTLFLWLFSQMAKHLKRLFNNLWQGFSLC
jgi:hypothetical protein